VDKHIRKDDSRHVRVLKAGSDNPRAGIRDDMEAMIRIHDDKERNCVRFEVFTALTGEWCLLACYAMWLS
jgi:hypothetical protein